MLSLAFQVFKRSILSSVGFFTISNVRIVYINVEHLDISFLYIKYLIKMKDSLLMRGLQKKL